MTTTDEPTQLRRPAHQRQPTATSRCTSRASGRSSGRKADKIIGHRRTPSSPARSCRRRPGTWSASGRLLRRGARRGLRGDGPVRLGQVHPRPAADPADRADRRHGRAVRRGHHRDVRRALLATLRRTTSRWSSSTSACCRTARSSTTSPSGSRCAARTRASAAAGPRRWSTWSGLTGYENNLPRPALRRHAAAGRPGPGAGRRPRLLMFDEPFSALDPLIRRDMQNEVIRLHHEVGKTMVFITHDLAGGAQARRPDPDHARRRDRPDRHAGRGGRRARPTTTSATSSATYRKSHVLTLKWVMREPRPERLAGDGPVLQSDQIVRDAAPRGPRPPRSVPGRRRRQAGRHRRRRGHPAGRGRRGATS